MKQNYLYKKYPTLFKLVNKPKNEIGWPLLHYGIQCDSGWKKLIDNMCKELTEVDTESYFIQIKEKFGGLRSYIKTPNEDLITKLMHITQKYEVLSYKICEVCGHPGTTKTISNYLITLCRKHRDEYISKRK